MRACEDRAEAISAYHDGELPQAERRALESHLAVCEGCRRRLAALEALRDGLRGWPDAAPPEELGERPMRAAGRRLRARAPYWVAAASVAAAALLYLWLGRGPVAPPSAPPSPVAGPRPAPSAQPGVIRLPEGVTVGELRITVRRGGLP